MADEYVDYGKNVVPFGPTGLKAFAGEPPTGGGDGGMEARIAKLEADMGHVKSRADEAVSGIKSLNEKVSNQQTDIAVLTERASHFATKTHSIVIAVAIVAALSGLILFAERLKGLIGL